MPSAEGGVALCFRNGGNFASLECLNTGEVIALTSDGKGNLNAWEPKGTSLYPADGLMKGDDAHSMKQALLTFREHVGA